MHNRIVIVLKRVGRIFQRLLLKVGLVPWHNVVPMDFHETITVGPRLLMENAQRMHQLVNGSTLGAQTIWAAIGGRLQRNNLSATGTANVRPTTARILNRPYQQKVLWHPIPWCEPYARHQINGTDCMQNGGLIGRIVQWTDCVRYGGIFPEAIGKNVPTAVRNIFYENVFFLFKFLYTHFKPTFQ